MPELFTEEMLEAFDRATAPVDEAQILPPVLYTSDSFFEFERSAIFEQDWLCVGRVEQIPNAGDWFVISLVGEPLLVVRGREGEIRVLSAVCQHRGMTVAEGCGNAGTIRCPYHHWTYGLDGRLLGAPAMERAEGFDKSAFSLPSLPVEVWNGFVFASLQTQPSPLAPTLTSLTDLLAHFALDRCRFVAGGTYTGLPWNWKVMHENFNDGYHAHRLHESINSYVRSEDAVFLPWSDDDNHVTRINYATHKDPSFNPTERVLMPVFAGLTDDERHRVLFALLPPTLGLAVTPDSITYFIVNPTSANTIDLHIGYCFDPSTEALENFDELRQRAEAGVNDFNFQDIDADTKVQVGLRSRFAPHGRYSWQEETLRQFNRWLVKRYRAHWPAPVN
jgi:phenylpropionate dioxygenase-like ring-hydroxylating dioxygenase large terminal subunit